MLDRMTHRARKPAAPPPARPADPTPAEEEAAYIRSLEKHGQLHHGKGPLPPGATHVVETLPDGTKRVRRKRFSAR